METNVNGSGASGADDKNAGSGSGKADDMVSKSELNKVLADMHKYKQAAKDAEERVKTKETEELKAKENWKKLYEESEKRAVDAETKSKKISDSFVNHQKFSTLKSYADKLGLRPEASDDLEKVDLDDIVVETTNTGKFSIIGADKAAERLKQTKPHWFTAPGAPNINVNSPSVVNGGEISLADVEKARVQYMKTKNAADTKSYQDAITKFKSQTKGR